MTREIAVNISEIFFFYKKRFEEENNPLAIELLVSILRLLDFEFLTKENTLVFFGKEPIKIKGDDNPKATYKVTPLDIKTYDRECLEDLLNSSKYLTVVPKIAPLFESIGWVVNSRSGTIRLCFEGSGTYEIWNEPLLRWDEDIDDDSCDWRSGTGWKDGLDLENIKYDWGYSEDLS